LFQQHIRTPGEPMAKLPKTSRLLDELSASNKLNLLDAKIREELIGFLADVAEHAPVIHISFASDPSSAFMEKIVHWFRINVNPSILVRVGLQPTLAAGCVVRTANRSFDMSLRASLERNRKLLSESLIQQVTALESAPVAPTPE